MFAIFLDFLHWLPSYFFPKLCFDCGAEGAYVCPKCKPKIKCLLSAPISLICPICQRLSFGGWVHPQCKTRYSLDRLISFYEYDGWAKKIIKNVKFKKNKIYRALTDLSSDFALALKGDSLPDKESPYEVSAGLKGPTFKLARKDCKVGPYEFSAILVPVPLHWYRRLKRGLNQSSLIAQALGRGLNIPVNEKILKRIRYTDPQTLIGSSLRGAPATRQSVRRLRLKNISGCFSANFPGLKGDSLPVYPPECVSFWRGKESPYKVSADCLFILVDDVWTTGTTLSECCRMLKRAGAQHVWALTLLRA